MKDWSHNTYEELAGLVEAKRVAKLPTRPPTDDDRPKRRSRPPRVIPGQLSIEDETRCVDDEELDAA